MRRSRVLIVFLLCISSCSSNDQYSKTKHLFTDTIGNQLYSEYFWIDSYGVGGDIYTMYITDSLNFRKFVSVYYDYESFQFKVRGNEILVIKEEETSEPNDRSSMKKVLDEYQFELNDLIVKGNFE